MELAEEICRVLFAALVAEQDTGMTVPASRLKVASDHGVSVAQVVRAEQEGLASDWPPLGG
jgi:hypothetical protein